jgi:glycosyltransferase involved in cell wall biosynthesis
LRELQKEWPELKLVFHEKNRGYGGALRSGFKAATKEVVFYTDGWSAPLGLDRIRQQF